MSVLTTLTNAVKTYGYSNPLTALPTAALDATNLPSKVANTASNVISPSSVSYYTPTRQDSSTGSGGTSGNGTGKTTNNTTSASLNSAAIANTNKSLAELPGILQRTLEAYQQGYNNAQQSYDAQQAQQQAKYDTNTTQNQQNYDANLMAALRSGVTGLSGLLSILRGSGAEGWAKNAVADTTNSDIRTGLNTQQQNQTSLDDSLSSFLTDLADKRHQNDVTLQNNQFAAQKANATQMQDLYTKLAGYYSDGGNNAETTKYMNLAGDQTSNIAKYGTVPVAAYNTTPAEVTAPTVTAFSSPTQQSITSNPGESSSNGIFTIGDTRKRLAGVGA